MTDQRYVCDLFGTLGRVDETIEVRGHLPTVIVTTNGCYVFSGTRQGSPDCKPVEAVYRHTSSHDHGGRFLAWDVAAAGTVRTEPDAD